MYERFTDRARKVMQLANQEAQRFNHEYIGTEHILLGLIKEGSGVAANVLMNLDVDLRKIRHEVEKIVQAGPDLVKMGKLPQTPRAKKVCDYAIEARTLDHQYVGTEHLLLGLLREEEGVAAQVLMNLDVKLEQVREEVLALLGHGSETLAPPKAARTRPAKELPEELQGLPTEAVDALRELEARIAKLQRTKEEAVAAEEFEKAADLKEEVEALGKQRELFVQTWRGRKTERLSEFEVYLPVGEEQPSTAQTAERIRQQLREQFGKVVESSQQVLGALQLGEATLTGKVLVFRVFSHDTAQAMVFFTRLREELQADAAPTKIAILSRKVEVL